MDIRWERGRLALNSATANYSYNHLHKVMQKALAKVFTEDLPSGKILNLGMGAGSTVSILREELGLKHEILSVEYDTKIIAVAKQYFDLDRFESHTVYQEDAFDFIQRTEGPYALIIIDLFKDKQVDARFLSEPFIRKCISLLNAGGAVLFNYIGRQGHPIQALLQNEHIELLEIEANRLLIYRNTERS